MVTTTNFSTFQNFFMILPKNLAQPNKWSSVCITVVYSSQVFESSHRVRLEQTRAKDKNKGKGLALRTCKIELA